MAVTFAAGGVWCLWRRVCVCGLGVVGGEGEVVGDRLGGIPSTVKRHAASNWSFPESVGRALGGKGELCQRHGGAMNGTSWPFVAHVSRTAFSLDPPSGSGASASSHPIH